MSSKLVPVNMKLRNNTIEKVASLKEMLHTNNRTEVVSTAVRVLESLVRDVQAGAKIIIQHKDGSKETIRFPGLL